MSWGVVFCCVLLGFGLVLAVVPMILHLLARWRLARSRDLHHTHAAAVPRFGGLALVLAYLAIEVCLVLFFPTQRFGFTHRNIVILGSLGMFLLGFYDDVARLGARRKLLGQILIASAVFCGGVSIDAIQVPLIGQVIELHGWGWFATVAWLVGITNLLNLIDGVDGLAGGIGMMLMALLVFVGAQSGTFVLVCAGMTGALMAFLFFNFAPARIYLGDGGAYLVGFQVAIFSLTGSQKGTVAAALMAPLIVLGLPILDTSLAVLRRGLHGLPVFRPDRGHLHHRLLRSGMTRREVVLALYGLTLMLLVFGLAISWTEGRLVPVLFGVVVLPLLLWAGKARYLKNSFPVSREMEDSLAMRNQIQYAQELSAWLKTESHRSRSLDEVYANLVFAASRLGFTAVKADCRGRRRTWSHDTTCRNLRQFRLEFPGPTPYSLEFHGPACGGCHSCREQTARFSQPHSPHCAGDHKVLEIIADLLAEGWHPAVLRTSKHMAPFSAKAPETVTTVSIPTHVQVLAPQVEPVRVQKIQKTRFEFGLRRDTATA